MKAAYAPLPGTGGARAMDGLRALPEGTWLGSGALAEIVGVETKNLPASLASLLKHGLVVRRKSERLLGHEWALGDGTPPASVKPEGEEPDDEKPLDPEMPTPDTRLRSAFDLGKGDGVNIDLLHGERLQGRKGEAAPTRKDAKPAKGATPALKLDWVDAVPPAAEPVDAIWYHPEMRDFHLAPQELADGWVCYSRTPAAGWQPEPPPPPAPAPLAFGCALWHDHTLQLRLRDGRSVVLEREDFSVLLRFIHSARVEVV